MRGTESIRSKGRVAIVLAILVACASLSGCPAPPAPEEGDGGAAAASDTLPPTNPTGLTAAPPFASSRINLAWAASVDNVAVAGYRVYRDGALIATLGNVTLYQDIGLTPSTSYSYRVQAFDAAGNLSPQSAAVIATTTALDTTPPTVPSGLTATAVSSSRIDVGWTASTDNIAVAGYQVFRDGSLVATLGNVTTYQNVGLTPATSYSYTVLAFDAVGNLSPQSAAEIATTLAPDTTPPTIPGGLTATPVSGSQINLSWAASTDNVAVTGYRIYQGGAPLVTLGNLVSYQVAGLSPGTPYSFTVSAMDGAGNESAQSAPPVAASTLTVNGTATLEWDAVNDPRLRGYRIYFSSVNQGNYQNPGQGLDVGNVTTYPVTGLLGNTRYYFKVTAYDASNTESAYSNEVFKDIP